MKRRITKLRVWETVTSQFFYDIDELFKNLSVIPSKIFNGEDKLLIPQFWTGLVDKNGRDVYEGDLIEITEPEREVPDDFLGYTTVTRKEKKDLVIVIRDEKMSFYGKKPEWEFSNFDIYKIGLIIEVIGNIFENNDLH